MAKKPKSQASRKSEASRGSRKKGKRDRSVGRKVKKVKTPEPSPLRPQPPVEPPKPKVRPKGTWIQAITPRPCEDAATCLLCYYDHDGGRNRKKPQDLIPGPMYNCEGVTRFGPVSQHGATINGRISDLHKGHLTPGPGHYSPEKYDNPRYHNAPEARLLGRYYEDKSMMYTSGPGNYNVPSSVGDFHPTYNSSPSARLMGRFWDKEKKRQLHFTPGPNEYDYDNNAFLKRGPSARLLGRGEFKVSAKHVGPGPGAYFADFVQGRELPSFSFGIRHAPCVVIPKEGDENF